MSTDLLNPERFILGRTTESQTGIRLFSLTDNQTGVTMTYPEPNARVDYASTVAWLGANTSRNGRTFQQCFEDLNTYLEDDPTYAAEKFGEVFASYGHASVGDMATVPLLIDDPTLLQAYRLFAATPIGSGQEWSTRYGKKKSFDIPTLSELVTDKVDAELETRWQQQKDRMAEYYAHFNELLRPIIEHYLGANGVDIKRPDTSDVRSEELIAWKKLQGTLNARTLDVARMFIPMGTKTKQAYVDSARDWVRMSGVFRQSSDPSVVAFGEQIVAMLLLDQRADAADIALHLEKFAKYAEGSDTAIRSIQSIGSTAMGLGIGFDREPTMRPNCGEVTTTKHELFKYESQTGILSALIGMYPNIEHSELARRVAGMSDEELTHISSGMFAGHNHHNMMHPAFDVRGIAFTYETALAYLRDINRHRSFGRHIVQFTTEDKPLALIERGWNANFALSKSEYWSSQESAFNIAMGEVYCEMHAIISDIEQLYGPEKANTVLGRILPLGAQMTMVLSAPVQQWAYMTSLRVGLGGDFGYRNDVWNMLEQIRRSDPGLSAMSSHLVAPNVNDIDQITGRS